MPSKHERYAAAYQLRDKTINAAYKDLDKAIYEANKVCRETIDAINAEERR